MSFARLRQWFFANEEPAPVELRSFSVPDDVRVYAVGDIHGRSELLGKMLQAIETDATDHPSQKAIQIFLGDYIDRGFYSKEVVEMLVTPPPKGHERVCLMGNHEEALLHFLQDPNILRDWANFGGYATLASYGIPIPDYMSPEKLARVRDDFEKRLPPAHLAFFRNLNLRHSVGDYLFVHAGIQPDVALEKQRPEDLLWIRESFLRHESYHEHYIVHGHTPVPQPDIRHNRANIDVSSATKGQLCSLVLSGDTRHTLTVTDEE